MARARFPGKPLRLRQRRRVRLLPDERPRLTEDCGPPPPPPQGDDDVAERRPDGMQPPPSSTVKKKKKSVTFGAVVVESCGDGRPRGPPPPQSACRPLVSIMKRSACATLVRPAKLTTASGEALLRRPRLVLDARREDDDEDSESESESESGTESESGSESPERRRPRLAAPPPVVATVPKVVLREARLQLDARGPADTGPFSSGGNAPGGGANNNSNGGARCASPTNPLATVTCGACGAVRFYRFAKQARKFGIHSCESCRKFISKMIKRAAVVGGGGGGGAASPPPPLKCLGGEGTCRVPPIVRSQQWKLLRCAYNAKCHACWLKLCVEAFRVPAHLKAALVAMLPPNMRPFGSKIANGERESSPFRPFEAAEKKRDESPVVVDAEPPVDANGRKRRHSRGVKIKKQKKEDDTVDLEPRSDSTKRQKLELKGPRVKHVCRSASIVLGQPAATFPIERDSEESDDDDASKDARLSDGDEKENREKPPESPPPDSPAAAACETNEPEETNDEDSIDSFDSALSQDTNKENVADVKMDTAEDAKESKNDAEAEPPSEVVREKKQPAKPFGSSSNIRAVSKKYNQQASNGSICTDFWESYDPEEVCNTGWGLISTAPFTVGGVCFLCGSRGKDKLVHCAGCCEMYHPYCAEIGEDSERPWLCPRCIQCRGCGKSGAVPASTVCRACRRHFHAECLNGKNVVKYRSDWPQICGSCLKCKSCESFKVTKFLGNLPFCTTCFRLRQKGNYCPLCQGCYQDNDFDSKMMECGWCSRWVHARCEGLSGEGYQLVSALPQSVEYICKQCMPENPPWRKMLKTYLRGKLLCVLKSLAKNKNACTLLKLTPHKNTPVTKRQCVCVLPTTVRKLDFAEDSHDEDPNKNRAEKVKGIVHKLQESLLQNKEICISMGQCPSANGSTKQSNDTCQDKNCCLKSKDDESSLDSEDSGKNERVEAESSNAQCSCFSKEPDLSPSLLDIKTRVNSNEYSSVKDFNKDMLEVISKTSSSEIKQIYKDVFAESFPWFDCELNCLNPSLEIEDENEDDMVKDDEMSDVDSNKNNERILRKSTNDDQNVPTLENNYKNFDECTYIGEDFYDDRACILCKQVGEGHPSMEERLLYCGQADWIHANCALWSAEVFEEIDGSLQNVQSAISRGKMIKCSSCSNKGASVGCCAKNCSETYHFRCARTVGCALLDDKRVFCPLHLDDAKDKTLQKDNDFILSRPVYVELDRKKKKYCDPQNIQFLLGSLVVKNLGKIVPSVSDFEDMLVPADFVCTRLYWSSKEPLKIVKYTIKTKLLVVEPSPAYDLGVNITLDHSLNPVTVDRILAEINSWHKSLERDSQTSKKDKSPIKFGNVNVSLEDYAVKQLMEYMLDVVCKQVQNDVAAPEEEPQNTADLLPPELKDAIFEDLNHDLLDGISMQDIFPKLCYEDLVAMDLRNEMVFGSEVMRDINRLNETNGDSRTTSQDFLEEIINAQSQAGKDFTKNKSELMINGNSLKCLTTRTQKSANFAWNSKLDNSLKRPRLPRPSFLTQSDGGGNVVMVVDGTADLMGSVTTAKSRLEDIVSDSKVEWQSKGDQNNEVKKVASENSPSPIFFKNVNKDTESSAELCSNNENEHVIDFYTKMRCSPISQLDGADDSSCHSDSYSPPLSPFDGNIPQLDGADDVSSSSSSESGSPPRDQNATVFFRPNNIDNTYTMTISAANLNNVISANEILMRTTPLEEMIRTGPNDQMVKCDRCHCTYRTKDSYNRHLPTCDLMSTSESEGETPKSPESRTLTTLQNAFNGPFVAPTFINQQNQLFESAEQFNISTPSVVTARRTSVNTRQITINGTIVETPPPQAQSPMKSNVEVNNAQEMSASLKTSFLQESPKITIGQGLLSPSQIMVATNLPVSPPRNQGLAGSKCGLNNQSNNLPYSICVKPNTGLHTIQSANPTVGAIAHMIPNSGQIQTVFSSNPGQVLTIANPSSNIIQNMQGKGPIMQTFANLPNGQTIALPMSTLQGANINAFVRPSLPIGNNSTILMSSSNTPRITSPNVQQKNQMLLPQVNQKSPKKLQQVQPKPIYQASRGRGRALTKAPPAKRLSNKPEKTLTAINPALGPGSTVIQFQPNGNSNQPSIILQQVGNPNVMSYVEAIQQQSAGTNMQYIATIAPQGDFKPAPTHYITQGGLMPQTFQIQQTESGLVAVPSGGIPVFLPQGGVGILPQASLQSQGLTLPSQGNIQSQGVNTILPQGTIHTQNGATILPQGTIQTQNGTSILPQATIQTQNGNTIIPQGATIQNMSQGNVQSQNGSLLSSNNLSSQGQTVASQNNNSQNIIGQPSMNNQNSAILSQQQGATILPQGAILPQGLQFCNDQVILGSAPTLEMVTDSSGCMYLTTQPVYYGLETIVQNTVMSSQQFVSTAMQGVLAQNSSFSATTTQVFQASKIEPIVEMPAGYVVVNNVPQDNIVVSQSNTVTPQGLLTQGLANGNIAVQPSNLQKNNKNIVGSIQSADKSSISSNRPGAKTSSMQQSQPIFTITSQGNTLSLQSIQSRNVSFSGKQSLESQPVSSENISSAANGLPNTTQSSMSTENIHSHIGQSIMSSSIGSNALSKATSGQHSAAPVCSESSNSSNQVLLDTQQLRTNFSQQCWKSNQNFTATSDAIIKGPSLIVQSSDNHDNQQKNNSNTNNVIGSVKSYNSYNDVPQIKIVSQSGNSNGNEGNNRLSSSNSYANTLLQNNNFTMSASPVLSTSTPHMNSGVTHLANSNINMLTSTNNMSVMKGSGNIITGNQLDTNSANNQASNQNSSARNISTSVSESANSCNIIHLPNNMMNLSLQNGKIYQIPMNGNSVPHMTLSSANSSNVQNQMSCNLQNGTLLASSNNQVNCSQAHTIHSQNNFHFINSGQDNCNETRLNSTCNQNQSNQAISNSNQLHGHILNSNQLANGTNNNIQQINNCNTINRIQMMSNSGQIQLSGSNPTINVHNANNNVSIITTNGSNDLNKIINEARIMDRNMHMENANLQNVNRNVGNSNIGNQGFNSNGHIIIDSSRDSERNASNNVQQYHISSDQMYLINNSSNIHLNANNNLQHRFQNGINQSDVQNQMQTNNESQSQIQNMGNQLNKLPHKQESFDNKTTSFIGTIPAELEMNKVGKQNNSTILSLPHGNQIGYIQMNGSNGQILSFGGDNRFVNNLGGQIQNQRNNTPMLTISDPNDVNGTTINQRKNNDIPSSASTSSSSSIISNPANIANKIHLPQSNIGGNCLNNSINFPLSSNMQNYTNVQLKNGNMNQINLPAQNSGNTISLPVLNTSNVTLPKAPPHQIGIPTNVVNPIPQYMRPMNRVLPIHRDAQSAKAANRQTKNKVEPPKPSPRCQDMPDLNAKDDEVVASDVEKAIRESKLTEQKKNEEGRSRSTIPAEVANVQIETGVQPNAVKTTAIETKSETSAVEKPPKTLRDLSTIKDSLQKLSKENAMLNNLKAHNINQRKAQMRSKLATDSNLGMKILKDRPIVKSSKEESPKMMYEISSEDGFSYSSTSLSELWNKVLEAVQAARKQQNFPIVKFASSHNASHAHILGLHNNALKYLIEQLPGAGRCLKYKAKHGCKNQNSWDSDVGIFESFRESAWGSARVGPAIKKSSADMFSWLASPYRDPPPPLSISQDDGGISRRATSTTLPMAMRFRNLKETSKHSVGVYRSHIHGRGLFCRRDIEAGEMVIEYAGEVIRAALADQRERRYEAARGGRGVNGCYMFRVDDHLVVDATMKGNAARFINHSCDPNCYSKVVDILGHKHILILALRRIYQGEELTYDYKFPFEEVKIPCTCGAKKCRKYLN